jgi:hypothetical protein
VDIVFQELPVFSRTLNRHQVCTRFLEKGELNKTLGWVLRARCEAASEELTIFKIQGFFKERLLRLPRNRLPEYSYVHVVLNL